MSLISHSMLLACYTLFHNISARLKTFKGLIVLASSVRVARSTHRKTRHSWV